jgi:hypothetical protein
MLHNLKSIILVTPWHKKLHMYVANLYLLSLWHSVCFAIFFFPIKTADFFADN